MHKSLFAAAAILSLGLSAAAHAAEPSYHVAGKIALPDGGWDLVSFDPTLGRIYIARSDAVTAIDVADQKVTGKLAPATGGHAAIPLNNGAGVLVTSGKSNSAEIFDAKTGAQLASIKTGEKPDAAMFDAATGLAVVMNAKSGDLTLIDPKTRTSVGSIPVGGSLELGAGDGTGVIYVNVEDKNEVVAIDLKARMVLAHITLTGCDGPTGIAYLPLAKRVLSSCANGVATITDPKTGKLESTLPIGKGPDTVMYDAQRHIAFVPAGRSGELDLFADEAKGVRSLGKVETQMGARTGALDEKTGKVYVIAAEYAPAVAGGRPQMKPGSVVAVVVAP